MSIVIWLCFAIMIAILATSIVNIARRGRADRLEYYKNYKKGKFWAIYFVAIPLFYLANKFNGSAADEAFFDAVKLSVDLVVLKYDYSAVKPLMEANSAFKAVMWLCFVMVALNASFLAVTIVYRRVLNHVWKERAKNAKKCYVVVGFNPQNKSIVKSIAKKGESANCIVVAKEVNEALAADKPNCDVVICTPFIHLASVTPIVDKAVIGVGAENCADKVSGAYTGEVSAEMVASTGAEYVILGHSERRAYYHETVEILEEKVKLALANNLKPIFCIGEVLEEREANKQNEVVAAQLASVFSLSAEDFGKIILAYEPVWAIGTGKTATAEQAQEIHAFIRSLIADKYGKEVADNTSILYGGSCKPSNAKELFANPDVDGGLIGGAALKVVDFKGIIDAFK